MNKTHPDINDTLRSEGPEAVRNRHDHAQDFAAAKDNGKARSLPNSEALKVEACPYRWPDIASIPPRQFLFGRHYVRKAMGATIAAGGRGKTTLGLVEFVSMACGKNLLTGERFDPLRAWYLNGEEDQEELDRKVAAICQRYGVSKADCGGRLFVQSVRDRPIRFASLVKNAPALNDDVLDQFEAEVKRKRIDVFGLDPWISFHSLMENDNGHLDFVLKEGLGGIASRASAAGEVFHHPGKPKPGQNDTTVEDARGASALLWAVRSARALNFMTPTEAEKLGISEEHRRLHVRVTNGKANMGPLGKATWFKLEVEKLPNGDDVACASPWKPPDPFRGVTTADMHKCRTLAQTGAYRLDSRSADWIGYPIAHVLSISVTHGADNNRNDLARIKQIVQTWLKNGVLTVEKRKDNSRKERQFVVPGPWSDTEPDPDPEEITLQ